MKIGIFEVNELSPGRWRAVNTLTTFEHVTYGTVEDVQLVLEKQSEDWERRFADNAARKPGKRAQENWAPRRTLAPMSRTPQFSGQKSDISNQRSAVSQEARGKVSAEREPERA